MRKLQTALLFVVFGLSFIPRWAEANAGDYSGAVAIGTGYAGISAAPSNGLIVEGNVGIGTTSPGFPLEVRGLADILSIVSTGDVGAGLVLDASVNSGHKYHFYSTTATAAQGAGYFLIVDETASWADRLTIDPSGNVGLGTTAPGKKLEVNGQVKINSFGSATSTSVCQLSGVLSTCSSSNRYKENIHPATFGLKEVMALQPVTFKWKGRDERDIGLVAEDVEKISPLFITYKNKEVEGVKYSQLTVVLIQAIQELKTNNDKLRADFETYKKSHP